jgi:hypothetical protein
MKKLLLLTLCILAWAGPTRAQRRGANLRDIQDRDIQRSMHEIRRFLYQKQNNADHWKEYDGSTRWSAQTGKTAFICFALIESGEDPAQAPKLQAALDWLATQQEDDTYFRASRIMAMAPLIQDREDHPYRPVVKQDVDWLNKDVLRARGAWGKNGAQHDGDNAASAMGLMALWEADRVGFPISPRLLKLAETTWIQRQKADGGWTFDAKEGITTPAMTAGALASLYLCQLALHTNSGGAPSERAMQRGWEYLREHLTDDFNKNGYLIFSLQRAGYATGRKFIGSYDWFAAGAAKFAVPNPRGRDFNGEWGELIRASFELIFLARGMSPLVFNKLAIEDERSNWNYHFCDIARFTEFMSRSFEERNLRWQVVRFKDDLNRLLDAPAMVVSDNRALDFTDEEWTMLKEYMLRGGTVFFIPINGDAAFQKSVEENLSRIFSPAAEANGQYYTWEPLPPSHKLYTLKAKIDEAKRNPMKVLSDGTRYLAFVCEEDIAKSWQSNQYEVRRHDFALGANLFFYTTGDNKLRTRQRPVFDIEGKTADASLPVAWVKHNANWYTQPYALEYLSDYLIDRQRLQLDVTTGVKLTYDTLKDYPLVWLTGSDRLHLNEEQFNALKQYLQDGGIVYFNAVGGSLAFNSTAQPIAQKLTQALGGLFGPAPVDHPLLTGRAGDYRGDVLDELQGTKFTQLQQKPIATPHNVGTIDGRIAIIYSPFGIHDTIDGHTAYGIFSYMPDSARKIAENVAIYAATAGKNKK